MHTREWEAKWIKPGDPIPEGWDLAQNEVFMNDHHTRYARMVVRKVSHDEPRKYAAGCHYWSARLSCWIRMGDGDA